jgi:alkanesulfonate monooxygenase SsuD/methylene tetrahydromethanopterin reductase-like flavin-dependent oxidoreductase (luciferase family)
MKFSVWPNVNSTPAEIIDTARWADQHGWFGVWFADHYMTNTWTTEVARGDTHECWAMLPALAATTSNVRIGSLVATTSVHHPAVLANRATTIDHISNGRMVLGLGAGWQINEHAAYGIELEPPGKRVQRFDEAIQIVRSLLDNEQTDFAGEVYTITAAVSDPKPIQTPLPIVVGTSGPRMLRITARHANEWNAWGAPDLARSKREMLIAACDSVGRDPATMHTSVQALLVFADTQADIDAAVAAAGRSGPNVVAGSVDALVETVGRYAGIGFDEFILPVVRFGATPEARRETLERISQDVFAQL